MLSSIVLISGEEASLALLALKEHTDGRVTRHAQDKIMRGEIEIGLAALLGGDRFDSSIVVGLSVVVVDLEGTRRGVTLTHRDHRNRGIGSAMLRERSLLLPGVVSRVWDGNAACVRMVAKADQVVLGDTFSNGKRLLLVGDRGD